jgi:transcriptional regulator with PAS, ATPase and Fis domain
MGLTIQSKILRVTETGVFIKLGDTKEISVNVRFIFATNKDIKSEIENGKFRKDLFFRMSAFIINLPSLRDKKKDIPLLANYFLEKFSTGVKKKHFSQEALQLLKSYEWPGNTRELANVIERSVLLSDKRDEILINDFPEGMLNIASKAEESVRVKSKDTIPKLAKLEEDYIENVLNSVGGNKSKAASLLGITRKTLYSKIGRHCK